MTVCACLPRAPPHPANSDRHRSRSRETRNSTEGTWAHTQTGRRAEELTTVTLLSLCRCSCCRSRLQMTTPRGAIRGNFAGAAPRGSPRTANPSPSPTRKAPLIAWNNAAAEASPAAASSAASSSSSSALARRGGADDRINVYLRPRPADANCAADGRHDREQVQIYADAEAKTVCVYSADTSKTIPCDGLIAADASQHEMYAAVGTRFVDGAMQGLSGCIFAYGQTVSLANRGDLVDCDCFKNLQLIHLSLADVCCIESFFSSGFR